MCDSAKIKVSSVYVFLTPFACTKKTQNKPNMYPSLNTTDFIGFCFEASSNCSRAPNGIYENQNEIDGPCRFQLQNQFLICSVRIYSNTVYSHWISILAALEVSFPRLLLATHRYSPLSVLLTLVIINCCFPPEKLILGLTFLSKGYPFLVHDIVGTGFPVALQGKIMLSPSFFVTLTGCTVILG